MRSSNYVIIIQGDGQHHSPSENEEDDANRLARELVKRLKASGHRIISSAFVHGGSEILSGH